MNIPRLFEKIFIRLLLLFTLLPLQSCTNTLLGEKLENSFDTIDIPNKYVKTSKKQKKLNRISKINSDIEGDIKEKDNNFGNIIKEKSISNSGRLSQIPIKSIKKTIFKPQPYRIILKLSGVNPSAPAERVTEALRKADVNFEVEKIERFYEENFSKDTSLKR